MSEILKNIGAAMARGRVQDLKALIASALSEGMSADKILKEGLITSMDEIGVKFSQNKVFIPEVMLAARAMNEGISALKPFMDKNYDSAGKVLVCTVKGDSHDIGKNLVKIMLEGAGFSVTDLGANVPTERIIQAVESEGIRIICLSALLTTTMPMMKDVIEKLKAKGIRESVKVLVGGAPVTAGYASSIGADGYSQDAAGAARLVKDLQK